MKDYVHAIHARGSDARYVSEILWEKKSPEITYNNNNNYNYYNNTKIITRT